MSLRPDLAIIAAEIPRGSRVLDVGCGSGALLAELRAGKQVDGRGMEIDPAKVSLAVARGLPVIQGDADRDLEDFPAGTFDYAVLSQTIQAMRRPGHVLTQLARLASLVIVGFPNFGHWRVRHALLLGGRMPMTKALPVRWHETPNVHLCTVRDFDALCGELGLRVMSRRFLAGGRRVGATGANWRAETAVYEVGRTAAISGLPPDAAALTGARPGGLRPTPTSST